MEQTQKTRKVQMRRLMGRTRAYFSKPANIILMVFFVALCFLTLYPLLTLLTETVTVHSGREARAVRGLGLKPGSLTLYHFQRLLLYHFYGSKLYLKHYSSLRRGQGGEQDRPVCYICYPKPDWSGH